MTSPYLALPDVVTYLRFVSDNAARKWLVRHRVPVCRRGRGLLYLRADLDAIVQQSRQAFVAAGAAPVHLGSNRDGEWMR